MKSFYPKKWVVKVSTGERVASELRMRIISGSITRETILTENMIANEFGASRSPVREAFKILSSEGLIRLERMGATVIGFSQTDIEEMYDVRIMIESFVFRQLLKTENNNLINNLNKILETMTISIKYKDAEELTLNDLGLHETIVYSINHNRIHLMWKKLRPVMECFILLSMRRRIIEAPEDFDRIIDNHELIIEAIKQKDENLACLAWRNNFESHKMLEKARLREE